MKKMKLAALSLSLFGVLAAGNTLAADSTQVNVSATVAGTCSFGAPTYDMDFGSFSVTDTGAKPASATLEFTCTNNTPYSIDDVAGARNLTGPGGETLAYSIAAYTTSGTANGGLQSVTLNGTIAQAAYQAASAGTYTETLTININP
jgi:hypothetical protein